MTISSETRQAGPFDGDGVVVDFPFAFKVFAASDVKVVQADADGVETVLVLTTDYTVALNGDQDANPGGTVTVVTAPATLTTLTITSQVEALQPTDLTNQGGFYPRVISDALDRLTILVQQALNSIGRTITVPISTPTTFNAELPIPTANRAVFVNDAGDSFELRDAGSVALAIPADSSVTTAKIDDLAVTEVKIAAEAVTAAKLHASATDVLFGRSSSGAGAGQEIACTAAGRALIDDANAAAQRATLGAAASGAATGSGLTMATARMLGRTTASTGAVEEISVGAGLSLTGGALTVAAGGFVQSVSAETAAEFDINAGPSVTPCDSSPPQITEGLEILTATITPTSASSVLRVTVEASMELVTTGVGRGVLHVHRDSTASAVGALPLVFDNGGPGQASPGNVTFSFDVTAGSTSATTFKFRAGLSAGGPTMKINSATYNLGGLAKTRLTVTELKA